MFAFQVILIVVIQFLLVFGTHTNGHENSIFQELSSYEVVHPELHFEGRWRRDLSTRTANGHVNKAVLSLSGFSRRFVLDVSINRALLKADYVERHFRRDGSEVERTPDVKEHCFYQGTVQGQIHSAVAISTCDGIEGMVFDGNQSFYVQPITENRNQLYHIMYRMEDLKLPDKYYDEPTVADVLPMENVYSEPRHDRIRRNVNTETKYVELLIVNDYSQYYKFNKNITLTNYRAKTIANLVDSLYRQINVRISLTMVETWARGDRIDVETDSDKCLSNFLKYRNDVLSKKYKNDNAQLLTNVAFDQGTVGKAQLMAMCTSNSGGVVQDHSSNAAATAATFAHEMGHNFGMNHDKDDCKCESAEKNQGCIMSAIARIKPSTEWSSCSKKDFEEALKRGLDSCLFNKPATVFGDAICGNGFKEEGEECDCGTVEECKKYSDSCCNATTCKLHDFADCSDGPCCENCKLRKACEVCREKVNECDIPELCTGKSELCPSNKYRPDGYACADGKGICYRGTCPTHEQQCDYLWGPEAESGPRTCYTVNLQGTERGNCHHSGNDYIKCELKDIMCGTLQCTKLTTQFPIVGTQRTVYRHSWDLEDGKVTCASTSLSLGEDVPDPGLTREGTKCADHKVCLNRKCVDLALVTSGVKPCTNNCTGRGICNNVGECFCDDHWGGEDCSESVPCGEKSGKDEEREEDGEGGSEKDRTRVVIILVCVFLALAVVVALLAFFFRRHLKQKWQYFRQSNTGRRYDSAIQRTPRKARPTPQANKSTSPANKPFISIPTFQSSTVEVPLVTVSADAYVPDPPPKTNRQLPGLSQRASLPPVQPRPPRPSVARRPESDAVVLDKPRLPPVPIRPSATKTGPLRPSPASLAAGKAAGKAAADKAAADNVTTPRPPSLPKTSTNDTNNAPKPRPPPLPKHIKAGQERPNSAPLKPSDFKRAQGAQERPFSVTAPSSASGVPPVGIRAAKPIPPVPRKPPKPNAT